MSILLTAALHLASPVCLLLLLDPHPENHQLVKILHFPETLQLLKVLKVLHHSERHQLPKDRHIPEILQLLKVFHFSKTSNPANNLAKIQMTIPNNINKISTIKLIKSTGCSFLSKPYLPGHARTATPLVLARDHKPNVALHLLWHLKTCL